MGGPSWGQQTGFRPDATKTREERQLLAIEAIAAATTSMALDIAAIKNVLSNPLFPRKD